MLYLADTASQSVVPRLIGIAKDIITQAGVEQGDEGRVEAIFNGFRDYIVPAREPIALSDILNAGWKAFHEPDFWNKHPEIRQRDRTLKELLLKSIEVLEFNSIMKEQE